MQVLVCSVVTMVLLFTFAVRVIRVDGPSMRETLQHEDLLLVLNGWLCGDYEAGDVVILAKHTFEGGAPIVKQVIATGGQTVDIDFGTGTVFVDGEALEEDYVREPTFREEGLAFPVTLAEHEIFVLGDNRNNSKDSRHPELGPVDTRYVIGRAVCLLMPGRDAKSEVRDWSRIGGID
jgi:signal peptidase I